MLNVDGTLTIEDSTITGNHQAVVVRAGNATITDSEIIVTGNYSEDVNDSWDNSANGGWGNGNEVPSGAVIVGNYVEGTTSSYAYNATVIITDTTIAVESSADNVYAIYADSNETYSSSVTISRDNTIVTGTVKNRTV